jgi:hypothetical protein
MHLRPRFPLAAALAALVLPLSLLTPAPARAFCGFYVAPSDKPLYNDATMVALMREGSRTVISMSNNYRGPAADFAMVVPVPVVLKKEDVKTLPKEVFTKLEALTAPRLVEYWEQDPCNPNVGMGYGGGSGRAAPGAKGASDEAAPSAHGVKIEAKFSVGEYDVLVLSAKESDGLETWLRENKYNIPQGASAALAPYIKEQMKFFVAKVDVKKVQLDADGVAQLSPIRFHYESTEFRLPVRLGLLNAAAKQDLIVFVMASGQRYEVANYPNTFIPTNLDVGDEARKSFAPFYATLFDATVARAGGRAVVTEYAWEAGSCDPCPTPPLDDVDATRLGGDVLFGLKGGEAIQGDTDNGYFGGTTLPLVITRLHARYDASTLTEDLVFKKAQPMVGGREFVTDDKGKLEKGATPAPENNFQARYAIRHKWAGPITCASPVRGVWGGPPSGVGGGKPRPAAATGLAGATRGGIKLASYVSRGLDDVAEYDKALASVAAPPLPPKPATSGSAASSAAAASAAPSAAPSGSSGSSAAATPSAAPTKKSCGCEVPGGDGGSVAGLFGVALAVSTIVARRRRRGA